MPYHFLSYTSDLGHVKKKNALEITPSLRLRLYLTNVLMRVRDQ